MALSLVNSAIRGTQDSITRSLEKGKGAAIRVSTGNRLDRAGTDIIALTIGEALRSTIVASEAALEKNIGQANSILDMQDNSLKSVGELLNQMKAIATIATGQLTKQQRSDLNNQMTALKDEITRVTKSAKFNGVPLLDGSHAKSLGGLENLTFDNVLKAVTFDMDGIKLATKDAINSGTNFKFFVNAQNKIADIKLADNAGKIVDVDKMVDAIKLGLKDSGITEVVKAGDEKSIDVKFGQYAMKLEVNDEWKKDDLFFGGKGVFDSKIANKGASVADLNDNGKAMIAALEASTKGDDGKEDKALKIMVGSSAEDIISFYTADATIPFIFRKSNKLDPDEKGPNINTTEDALKALTVIDTAIDRISSQRSATGVSEVRFSNAETVLSDAIIAQENTRSRFQDTDYVTEPGRSTTEQIKTNAGVASLSQIMKQQSNSIMQLINSSNVG